MEFINAKEAAHIAGKARVEAAQYKISLAKCCVKDGFMPQIKEAAEDGKSVVVINITQNHDVYKVRDIIVTILRELDYKVWLEKEGKEFTIEW